MKHQKKYRSFADFLLSPVGVLVCIGIGVYLNRDKLKALVTSDSEKDVLDVAQINGLPVGVDENGKLIVYNDKEKK